MDAHCANAGGAGVSRTRGFGLKVVYESDGGASGDGTHRAGSRDLEEHHAEKTGYEEMLKTDKSPDADSRLANIEELINAAAEATERGETASDFLDHAALVADADQVDERAPVSLLTIHNAKGLEFSDVFLAGLEEGLFPHSRSLISETAMEEERRLCYVGMTRAEKRLYLIWARYRRRFGGGQPEASLASRFLSEVPPSLCERLSPYEELKIEEVDLYSEQHEVRESVKNSLHTGRTYNSLDNIAKFFADRGMPVPLGIERAQRNQEEPSAHNAGYKLIPSRDRKGAPRGLRPSDGNEEALFVGGPPGLRPTPTSARPRIPETVQSTASSTERIPSERTPSKLPRHRLDRAMRRPGRHGSRASRRLDSS